MVLQDVKTRTRSPPLSAVVTDQKLGLEDSLDITI
jgi:hypothetical protein